MPEVVESQAGSVALNALSGIRVVEFGSNFAGPYAGMILAQLGADVIKVESPDGDDARGFAGRIGDTSIAFAHVNVGKRGVVIDMKTEGGRDAVHRLLSTADVVVQSLRPGAADALGIGREEILRRVPGLLYYDVTAFGNGPEGRTMPGYDPMVQAFTGIMQMTGHDGSPPTRCAPSVIDFGTGQWVALGILAALLARTAGEPVRSVDTALVDTAFSVVPYQATAAAMHHERPPRSGSGNPIAAPYQCYRAKDGYLLIAAANQRLWRALATEIGAPELLTDERFSSTEQRSRHRAELEEIIDQRLAGATVEEWTARLRAARVPAGSVMHLDEAVASGIAVERRTFARAGDAELVRLPFLFDGRPLAWRRPAPHLGEHTVAILGELGYEPGQIDELVSDGAVGTSR